MDKRDMLKAMGNAEVDLVEQAAQSGSGSSRRKRILAIVICLAVVCSVVYTSFIGMGAGINLERSDGVSVRKPLITFAARSSADLVELSEDELINGSQYNFDCGSPIEIFYGTVKDIENISVSFGGEKEYWSIVSIDVGEVLRGSCQNGDTVNLQLHFPINGSTQVEDTGVLSHLSVGMKGIFLPQKYGEDVKIIMNGDTLYCAELAPYGVGDGERCAFLEGKDGLIYSSLAYPSVKASSSLEEVEVVIRGIMK